MTTLVVGLGNPGPEYELTRHNVGFMVVDLLAQNLRATYWKQEGGASTSHVRAGDRELILAKPQTFMNVSGRSVKNLAESYGIALSDIIVIHDDLDLPDGSVRAKRDGGHGGHNGLRSINEAMGPAYPRVRVGIGRPPGRMDPARYVLEPLSKAAVETFTEVVPVAAQCLMDVVELGIDTAMQKYNVRG